MKDDEIEQDDDIYIIDESGEVVAGDPEEPEGLEPLDQGVQGTQGPIPLQPADTSVAALQKEIGELQDQNLRSRADFENFRRRMEREKSDYFKHALSGVMRDVLPVLDNFERALASGSEGGEDFHKGIELIHKQFVEALQKQGLRSIDTAGVPFDPTIHEAIMSEERADMPSNTVVAIFQKGFFLNDRLVRPAMVKVSTGEVNTSGGQE